MSYRVQERLFLVLGSLLSVYSYGQQLGAYYSGLGMDTLGTGGVNSVFLCFFDPSKMTAVNCNFSDPNTPCVASATGGGGQGLQWVCDICDFSVHSSWIAITRLQILSSVIAAAPQLTNNTAPIRGGKPLIFISFGGANEGGAPWDTIFASAALSSQVG